MLFVQIRFDDVLSGDDQKEVSNERALKSIKMITEKCLKYKIEGIIVQDSDSER